MSPAGLVGAGGGGGAGELDGEPSHLTLVATGPPRDAFHHVAIAVTSRKRHPGVNPRRVLLERPLHDAFPLDERLPVHAGDVPQAGDTVRHRHLGQGDPLGGPGGGVLGADSLLGDPPLEPDQRLHRAAHLSQALEEAGDEGRSERGMSVDEVIDRRLEGGAGLPTGGDETFGPTVGLIQLVQPLHRTPRHAPDALEQPQAKHRGHGPQLTDGEGRDLLKGADEEIDVVELDAPFGVGDQGDSELVNPRISR